MQKKIVMVTHEVEYSKFAQKVIYLDDGQIKLIVDN